MISSIISEEVVLVLVKLNIETTDCFFGDIHIVNYLKVFVFQISINNHCGGVIAKLKKLSFTVIILALISDMDP